MSAHTPGPWKAEVGGDAGYGTFEYALIRSARGSKVADARLSHVGSGRECQANAALIAAAPELLEALIGLVPLAEMDVEANTIGTDLWSAVHAARAAIKKAAQG